MDRPSPKGYYQIPHSVCRWTLIAHRTTTDNNNTCSSKTVLISSTPFRIPVPVSRYPTISRRLSVHSPSILVSASSIWYSFAADSDTFVMAPSANSRVRRSLPGNTRLGTIPYDDQKRKTSWPSAAIPVLIGSACTKTFGGKSADTARRMYRELSLKSLSRMRASTHLNVTMFSFRKMSMFVVRYRKINAHRKHATGVSPCQFDPGVAPSPVPVDLPTCSFRLDSKSTPTIQKIHFQGTKGPRPEEGGGGGYIPRYDKCQMANAPVTPGRGILNSSPFSWLFHTFCPWTCSRHKGIHNSTAPSRPFHEVVLGDVSSPFWFVRYQGARKFGMLILKAQIQQYLCWRPNPESSNVYQHTAIFNRASGFMPDKTDRFMLTFDGALLSNSKLARREQNLL